MGVNRVVKDGGRAYWIAGLTRKDGYVRRSFSVARYGEKQALAMALAQREDMLSTLPAQFTTTHHDATLMAEAHFAAQLQQESAIGAARVRALAKETARQRIAALNAWFDKLRPRYVSILLSCTFYTGVWRLQLRVSDKGWPTRKKVIVVYLRKDSWAQAQVKAWERLQRAIVEMHDADCWDAFQRDYRAQFFATSQEQTLSIVLRCTSPDDAQLRQPPSALASLLPGFAVPPLPPFEPVVRVAATVAATPDQP